MSRALDAIVLTGGRGSRLGGVDKATLRLGGPGDGTLGAAALGAVTGPGVTVVVGTGIPDDTPPGRAVIGTVEDPRGAGPLAGIAAGLAALRRHEGRVGHGDTPVALLACDLPSVEPATVALLAAALRGETGTPGAGVDDGEVIDAVLAVDDEGRDQYLLAVWRREVLGDRLASLGDPAGLPVRRLLEGARVRRVTVGAAARDVDTWADVAARGPVGLDLLGPALVAGISPLPARAVRVLEAGGVLAEDLIAADAMPRMPVSAMDGYALAGPGPWTLRGHARRAGDSAPLRLSSGECVPIATGALAPAGTDRALRHELVRVDSADIAHAGTDHPGIERRRVHPLPAADGVDDLRPVGEDWSAGAALLPAGTGVDAAVRSVALTAGVRELAVRGPVRARLFTTGDEVLPAHTPDPLPDGRIRDTAGPVLPGVLAAAGMQLTGPAEHLPDDPAALARALGGDRSGAGPDDAVDVVVLIGATGRGPADHLRPVLDRLGARLLVDGVRMRPGGSQLVAELPGEPSRRTLLLALPGNPLAAVCAAAVTGRLVVDALTRRSRSRELARVEGVSTLAAPARARVLPARPGGSGGWEVASRARTSHLLDLVGSAGLVVIPPGAGDAEPVEVLRWE